MGGLRVPRTQLFMRRPDLTGLPASVVAPAGFGLRTADVEDDVDSKQLATVLTEAFGEPWTPGRVRTAFSRKEGVQATYVATADQHIVGTASVRLLPDLYPDTGYVHWVGVLPAQQGKKLGQLVTERVLVHFDSLGLTAAVLETDDFRLPAITTYLRLGFVPEYRHPDHQKRWSAILRTIVQPRPR